MTLTIIVGTPDADEIIGTDNRDRITGLGGDDRLYGRGGADLIFGVAGMNIIYGEDGNDALVGGVDGGDGLDPDDLGKEYDPPLELTEQLYGGNGNDWIDGGAGEDSIFGGEGNDLLQGGPGHDYLVGGAGDDLIYGDAGLDQIYGGDGNDIIIDRLNAPNADHGEGLNGGAGDDLLIGSDSWNVLTGGTGADVIMGGGFSDVMTGGDPIYETIGGVVTLVGGTLDGATDRFVFNEGDGHDSIYGFETGPGGDVLDLSRIQWITSRDDLYIGVHGSNVVIGLGTDSSVVLVGVSDPSLLTEHNFIFRSPETDNPVITQWADYTTATAGVVAGLEAGLLFRGRTDGIVPYGAVNMRGSSFDDVLAGDDADNRLEGGNGNDILEGRAGDDWLVGGAGADILSGGEGFDVASYAGGPAIVVDLSTGFASDGDILLSIEGVVGSSFNDTLIGSDSDDMLDGGPGHDVLEGGAGADRLIGGTGNDTAVYASSPEGVTISLHSGNTIGGHAAGDTFDSIENLIGSAFADFLKGDREANILRGGDGDDRLEGHDGDDVLEGGAGADRLDGGRGNDTAAYWYSPEGVTISLLSGNTIGGHAAGDTFISIENLIGSDHADFLKGNREANTLWGGRGDDRLEGHDGDDVLEGGPGADLLNGGNGNDTAAYTRSSQGVIVDLAAGTGSGGDAEGDRLIGIENLIGSNFDDILRGDVGANTLNGGAGNDILVGGAGADRLVGGNGSDTADYSGSPGGVTISLLTGNTIGGHAAGDTFDSIENLTGSAFADFLKGDRGANLLRGGGGDDRLEGHDGDDLLIGGAGADRLDGGRGNDTADYSESHQGVTISLLTGNTIGGHAAGDTFISIENLTGSAFADFLKGDDGGNILIGGDGDDRLEGRGGDDILIGGAGNDAFVIWGNSGVDIIVDFVAGAGTEDWIDLTRNGFHRSFDSVMASATSVGDDTVIHLGGANYVTLQGVARQDLHQDDFVF